MTGGCGRLGSLVSASHAALPHVRLLSNKPPRLIARSDKTRLFHGFWVRQGRMRGCSENKLGGGAGTLRLHNKQT